MKIAIKHPGLVDRIIIGSSFYKRQGLDPHFWPSIENAPLKDMPQQLQETYKQVAPDSNSLIKMFEKDKARMIGFTDWKSDDIKLIKAPSLILIGDHDVVLPEHAVEMYRLMPNAQLAIVPGGHGKYIGEITTLVPGDKDTIFSLPMIEGFLHGNDKK